MRRLTARLAVALACAALLGCAEPPPPQAERPFELRALTADGVPLSGLRAWLDGAALGETSSEGRLQATLRGRPGQRLRLSWACPVAHEPAGGQRDLALDAGAPAAAPAPLKLEARCTPRDVQAALVVRASGAPPEGIPIRVRDEVVARTDAGGLAHVVLRARRGSALTVALDTSAYPQLVPKSPIETFQLGDEDTILLLERALSTRKSKRLAKPEPRKAPEIRKPLRISSR